MAAPEINTSSRRESPARAFKVQRDLTGTPGLMRKLLTMVVAAVILAVAYTVTFGMPGSGAVAPQSGGNASVAPTAGAGAPRGPAGRSRATAVVTTPLEFQPYESVLNAIGTASALRSVDVASNAAGTVIEANLSSNREVAEGDVLVRLDARTQALNLEIAQANLEQANDTVDRYERLRVTGSSTVTDVTATDARLSQRLAEAAVGLAEVALEDRTIRAPISGRLGLSEVEVGDTLSAGDFIVSLDQSETLQVEFELPERAIGMLAEADEILASTSAFTGKVITGSIVSFDSRIDAVTRSVTVKAQIDNSDGALWPGMTFAVRLMQQSEPLAMLPSTAITWSRDGSTVWINADGVAQQVPVTILFRQNEAVWIEADIPEGTMVVTEGAQKLRDGAQISAANEPGNRPGRPAGATGAPTADGGQGPQSAPGDRS